MRSQTIVRPFFKKVTDNTVHQVYSGKAYIDRIIWHNDDNAARFMQIFNKLSTDVVLATTTPDQVIQLGADSTQTFPFGDVIFDIGFSFAITTTRNGSTEGQISDVMVGTSN